MGLARKNHKKGKHAPATKPLPAERFPLNQMESVNLGKDKATVK